jgi:hypothetical protein
MLHKVLGILERRCRHCKRPNGRAADTASGGRDLLAQNGRAINTETMEHAMNFASIAAQQMPSSRLVCDTGALLKYPLLAVLERKRLDDRWAFKDRIA